MDDGTELNLKLDTLIAKVEAIEQENLKIKHLLKILVKGKFSNKVEEVMEALQNKKRMDTQQVKAMFNISRPWALELMRKVSALHSNVSFIPGNKDRQRPTQLILCEEEDNSKVNKIKHMLEQSGNILPMAALEKEFKLPFKDARFLAENFCLHCSDYIVDETACERENLRVSLGVRIILNPKLLS